MAAPARNIEIKLEIEKTTSLTEEIKVFIDKQPRIEDLKGAQEIKQKLKTGKIIKVLHRFKESESKIYLVLLDNNLLAVFKERKKRAQQKEILAFEMATVLFKLPHTIPPTIACEYYGLSGVLQYYAVSCVNFKPQNSLELYNRHNMELVKKEISRDSYADFLVFKYITALDDVNLVNLVVWKNASHQYCLTHIDNEYILGTSHTKFGETLFGKIDINNSDLYSSVVKSWYTSIFNPTTLDNIASITRDDLMSLLALHYPIAEGSFKIISDMFFQNRDSLLEAALLPQKPKLTPVEGAGDVFTPEVNPAGANSLISFSKVANDIRTLSVPKLIKDDANMEGISHAKNA